MLIIINFNISNHFPAVLMDIIAYFIIGFLAFRIYKKLEIKPKIWKVLLILFIGLFSFSIDLTLFSTFVQIPILPLGVWILYFIYRNKEEKWAIYRGFAWLGFFANFIFLAATFAAIPVDRALYPEKNLSTFISKTDGARIFPLHTSAKESTLNQEVFKKQLSKMKSKPINSQGWYNEIVNIDVPQQERKEKFPYQIVGTEPKWGSDLNTTIFVEKDGKGLLLTTQKKQYYFRSDVSFLEGLE